MNIVVDTNIFFSAMISRHANSNFAGIFSHSGNSNLFRMYSVSYMLLELAKHQQKLLKASRLSLEELEEVKLHLLRKIEIINWEIIPAEYWQEAEQLVEAIDDNDIMFVALSLYLNAYLWTGDMVLYRGLRAKGFNRVLTTAEMMLIAKYPITR